MVTVAGLALVLHEVTEPVVLAPVFVDGRLYAGRDRNLVVQVDDLFGTLDDPRQYAFPSIVIEVLAVVLDVALAGNLGVERDDDEPTPFLEAHFRTPPQWSLSGQYCQDRKRECHLFFVQKLSVFTSLHMSRFILSSRGSAASSG